MRKLTINSLLLSFAALLLLSCNKEVFENQSSEQGEGTISSITIAPIGSSDAQTKVSFEDKGETIGSVGLKPSWEVGDEITIYLNDIRFGNYKCENVSPEGSTKGMAIFKAVEGIDQYGDRYLPKLRADKEYVAVYPASTELKLDDRNSKIADSLKNQEQSKNDLTHLDKYLFMSSNFTTDANSASTQLSFKYDVSVYVLTFPWVDGKATSVKFTDGSKSYTLNHTNGGFAKVSNKSKVYFMIQANSSAKARNLNFDVQNASTSKNFTKKSSKSFVAGKTYRATITQFSGYIDEYGINRGPGIKIDGKTWAPVNLGYHEKDYPYGKLYQWGRKVGHGFDNSEGSVPSIKAALNYSENQNPNDNEFYKFIPEVGLNSTWIYETVDGVKKSVFNTKDLWHTYSSRSDKLGNPCPEGWRVPTIAELNSLIETAKYGTNELGQKGFAVSGSESANNSVFLPAAGMRIGRSGETDYRGSMGWYWSASPINSSSNAFSCMKFMASSSKEPLEGQTFPSNGYSVRCIAE